jgi:hypothetical protein
MAMILKPCKWCRTGTKAFEDETDPECDRCWELRSRIQDNPVLAKKILGKLLLGVDNKGRYSRLGNVCADKVIYEDGIGYTLWFPFPGHEDAGLGLDIGSDDIDNVIDLLLVVRNGKPHDNLTKTPE